MLTIDIAIATFGTRIGDVKRVLRPQEEGLRYVVSWQDYHGVDVDPDLENRSDVDLLRFDGEGLPANRNNALEHCCGDIVVIGDDDIIYCPDGFAMVRSAFERNPEMDVALFRVEMPVAKPYPGVDCRLDIPFPEGYWVSGIEITFRRSRIGDLRFHPLLRLGSELFGCGEDEFFAISAIKRGLDCRFVDRLLCYHPAYSSGAKTTAPILRAQGALIAVMYPMSWVCRLPLKAWRLRKSGKTGFAGGLLHLMQGALKRGLLLKSPRSFRW